MIKNINNKSYLCKFIILNNFRSHIIDNYEVDLSVCPDLPIL